MYAHTAADALSVVGRFRHIHIHLAGFGAFSAGDALVFIHLNLEEGHPVELAGVPRDHAGEREVPQPVFQPVQVFHVSGHKQAR